MKRKRDNNNEIVVLCREWNQRLGEHQVSVIKSGITDNLLKVLKKRSDQNHKMKYFITHKTTFQKMGAVLKRQVLHDEIGKTNRIVEL